VLKIHAYNRRGDVSTEKRGFVVTSDPNYCSLVLVNRGLVLSEGGNVATVEVKVQGPATQLRCVLDDGEEFQCKDNYNHVWLFCSQAHYYVARYICFHVIFPQVSIQ